MGKEEGLGNSPPALSHWRLPPIFFIIISIIIYTKFIIISIILNNNYYSIIIYYCHYNKCQPKLSFFSKSTFQIPLKNNNNKNGVPKCLWNRSESYFL